MPKRQSRAVDWWRRALDDGKHCAYKRRELYFEDYREAAEQALLPGPMTGPFTLLYRMGFRLGYDNALQKRELESKFATHKKKR